MQSPSIIAEIFLPTVENVPKFYALGTSRSQHCILTISTKASITSSGKASIPADKRWIPKGMEVAYTAKATSAITCIAETDPAQWDGEGPDLPVRVRGVRDDGTVVVEGEIRLWVTPRQRV